MDKVNEALDNALPCPHCRNLDIRAHLENLNENLDESVEIHGRFYCPVCGASTRLFPLGVDRTEEHASDNAWDSESWESVLAAWNLRAAPPSSLTGADPATSPAPKPATAPAAKRSATPKETGPSPRITNL